MVEPAAFNGKTQVIENLELVTLHQFALILNSSHNIDQILLESAAKINDIMDSEGCHILFTRSLRNRLKLETAIHAGGKPLPDNVDETKGISGSTFRHGQVIIVADAEKDPRVTKKMQEHFGHRSMVSVPITVKGKIMGVIVIYHKKPSKYTERDAQFLMMLGTHLGLAVENANLMLELKKAAILDPLTGAYNYRYFQNELASVVEEKSGRPISLIMIDINNFKNINDNFGHLAGDKLLQDVASVLKENVRGADTVARYGGDEFAVILPGSDTEIALQVAGRIETAIASHIFKFEETEIRTSVSWGAITTVDKQVSSVSNIIEMADKKLYNMKKQKKVHSKSP